MKKSFLIKSSITAPAIGVLLVASSCANPTDKRITIFGDSDIQCNLGDAYTETYEVYNYEGVKIDSPSWHVNSDDAGFPTFASFDSVHGTLSWTQDKLNSRDFVHTYSFYIFASYSNDGTTYNAKKRVTINVQYSLPDSVDIYTYPSSLTIVSGSAGSYQCSAQTYPVATTNQKKVTWELLYGDENGNNQPGFPISIDHNGKIWWPDYAGIDMQASCYVRIRAISSVNPEAAVQTKLCSIHTDWNAVTDVAISGDDEINGVFNTEGGNNSMSAIATDGDGESYDVEQNMTWTLSDFSPSSAESYFHIDDVAHGKYHWDKIDNQNIIDTGLSFKITATTAATSYVGENRPFDSLTVTMRTSYDPCKSIILTEEKHIHEPAPSESKNETGLFSVVISPESADPRYKLILSDVQYGAVVVDGGDPTTLDVVQKSETSTPCNAMYTVKAQTTDTVTTTNPHATSVPIGTFAEFYDSGRDVEFSQIGEVSISTSPSYYAQTTYNRVYEDAAYPLGTIYINEMHTGTEHEPNVVEANYEFVSRKYSPDDIASIDYFTIGTLENPEYYKDWDAYCAVVDKNGWCDTHELNPNPFPFYWRSDWNKNDRHIKFTFSYRQNFSNTSWYMDAWEYNFIYGVTVTLKSGYAWDYKGRIDVKAVSDLYYMGEAHDESLLWWDDHISFEYYKVRHTSDTDPTKGTILAKLVKDDGSGHDGGFDVNQIFMNNFPYTGSYSYKWSSKNGKAYCQFEAIDSSKKHYEIQTSTQSAYSTEALVKQHSINDTEAAW